MVEIQSIYKLFLSLFLGSLIGLEREYKKKEAGFQTYSLVSLGCCFFTMISFEMGNILFQEMGIDFDPVRIVQAITIGIGFIGAGTIFQRQSGVSGLTTAAGLWITSAIGVAVGAGFYSLSTLVTILSLLILFGFGLIEERYFEQGR